MNTIANPWGLTPRQCQVLQALPLHGSMNAVAKAFGICTSSAETAMKDAQARMGGVNRYMAVVMYAEAALGRIIEIEPQQNRGRTGVTVRGKVEAFYMQADPDDYLTIRDAIVKFDATDPAVRAVFKQMADEGLLERFIINGVQAWRCGHLLKAELQEAA
jgi:DNA-binding CsgD family transcriptional regulator